MNAQIGRSLIAELLGTFALVFIGAGAIVTNQWTKGAVGLGGIAAAHALVLSVMISALGHISGGHFNPAVTFGVWIARRISTASAAMYWSPPLRLTRRSLPTPVVLNSVSSRSTLLEGTIREQLVEKAAVEGDLRVPFVQK